MAPSITIRPAAPPDVPQWVRMRRELWPDQSVAELTREAHEMHRWEPPCVGLVAETVANRLIGFVEVGVRSLAEGCPAGPAAYIEGIWVDPEHRRRGVARALLAAAERWGFERGLTHLGSDARLTNATSHAWHRAAGFAEIDRLVVFAKPIAGR